MIQIFFGCLEYLCSDIDDFSYLGIKILIMFGYLTSFPLSLILLFQVWFDFPNPNILANLPYIIDQPFFLV